MSQNPFAHPADIQQNLGDQMPLPARTSVTAILSLVSSLICCIPGLGLLGMILGIASLVFISSSQGRLAGKGMAWTGIILGALLTALWVGVFIGGSAVAKGVLTQSSAVMTAIEKQDYPGARREMGGSASAITDEQFDAFRTAYQAELGSPKVLPLTVSEWYNGFKRAGNQFQSQQPSMAGQIPIPAEFDNGMAIILLQPDQSGGQPPPPGRMLPIGNVHLLTPSGKHIWLTGPNAAPPASTPTNKPPSGGSPPSPPPGG